MPALTDSATDASELTTSLEQLLVWMRRAVRQSEWNAVALSTLDVLDRLGPHRITDLTARERITQPGMTGVVGRLDAAGLVERQPDPRDGRATLVTITDAGQDYLRELRRGRARLLAEHIDELPPHQRQALLAAGPALAALAGRPLPREGA